MTVHFPSSAKHTQPPVITGAGELMGRYDVILCDVWGVLHDGLAAYDSAGEALTRFREKGGTVVLVSNAPVPRHRVQEMLDARRVRRTAFDYIVSSGDLALEHLADKGYERVHYIGPRDRDAAFFERSAARPADLHEAEAIVCTGLEDDKTETAETYAALLQQALERALPFVCANPDLVVDVGGRLFLCAGALAEAYEQMGGPVFWAGKPFPVAYESAIRAAEAIRGGAVDKSRILAIGDAIRTDLAGAQAEGIDALFITSGIHREETMNDGHICEQKLAKLFADGTAGALAAMPVLRW